MVGQSKIKTIGVIGLGSIGQRHTNNLIDLGYKVIGYDPDTTTYCESDSFERSFHIDGVLKESDAIVIASPTEVHLAHILLSAKKPIFVEKPVANIASETCKLATMVGYNLRFRSCVIAAKEWMPRIGNVIWANFTVGQFNDKPDYLRDGVILNWSHEIDLALYLLGPATVATSVTGLDKGNDVISDIVLLHGRGGQSCIHLDYLTKPEIRQFVIVGSDATIICDVLHNQAWLRGADEIVWDHSDDVDSFDDNYKDEMQAFLDRIDGKDVIGCTGSEALEVLKVCLEVRKQAGL